MAAQKGRDLLLKVDATGGGSFQTVAGLRASTIAFNAQSVDSTSQESVGAWRELKMLRVMPQYAAISSTLRL
jgi:TP901-1 family phage major tail protein